jgi:HD superfamily phosphohydrolase
MTRTPKPVPRIKLDPGPLRVLAADGHPLLDDYVLLNKDGSQRRHATGAVPLGSGGSSMVFRIRYKDTLDRALKILDPRRDLFQSFGLAPFLKTFNSEIQLLARITHTNIAKLVDWGTLTIAGDAYPYFIMDYVDGERLTDFCKSTATTATEFLDVMRQTLDAVVYLHAQDIMHCDIKAENVIVRVIPTGVTRQLTAVILDLGVAKIFPSADSLPLDGADTYFYSSERITAPELKPYLGKRIPRSLLRTWFPRHDLNGIGVLIQEALLETGLIDRLRSELGQPIADTIEVIRERLAFGAADRYRSAVDVARDWRKLAPTYLSPLGVPELSLSSGSLPSIATPLGAVEMTARTYRLVNHPLFQRLQVLPQLDLLYLLYPGAHHSRFVHSLETYRLTKRYVAALLSDARFRVLVDAEDIEALLLRALLHDIGHYPLAHMFEDYVEYFRVAGDTHLPSDDDLFWVFIGVPGPAALSRFPPTFLDDIRAISDSVRGDGEDRLLSLAGVLAGTSGVRALESLRVMGSCETYISRVLAGILSSPCDADKVAYLGLDSQTSGVAYGRGIDLDGLLGGLRMPEDNHERVPMLGITAKALSACEQIVLARYWMIHRVYWHHANRALMAGVKFVIAQLLVHGRFTFVEYLAENLMADARDGLQWLSSRFELVRGDVGGQYPLRNPVEDIVRGRRTIYKRFVTVSHGIAGGENADRNLYDAMRRCSPESLLDLGRRLLGEVAKSCPTYAVHEGDLIFDVPHKERERTGGQVMVYADENSQATGELFTVSPLLGQLAHSFDQHTKRCRVYVHPDLHAALGEGIESAAKSAKDWLHSELALR